MSLIGSPGIFYYGAFVFLSVYAYSEFMDSNPFALFWVSLKNGLALFFIWQTGDWFGIDSLVPGAKWGVVAWFVIATLVTAGFVFGEVLRESRDEKGRIKWSF